MRRAATLVIAIILLILAAGALAFAALASSLPDIGAFGAALFGSCAVLFGVPGILLTWIYVRATREEAFATLVTQSLPVQGQLTLRELAALGQRSDLEAEGMVMRMLAKRRIPGVWDSNGRRLVYAVRAPPPPMIVNPPVYAPPPVAPPAAEVAGSAVSRQRFCRQCGTPVTWNPDRNVWRCPGCGNEQ